MKCTKKFEIAVLYNILNDPDHDIPMDGSSKDPIEEIITISIECNEIDFPEDCDELDNIISENGQYVDLYSAVIEAIAQKYDIDPGKIDLIDDPSECNLLD